MLMLVLPSAIGMSVKSGNLARVPPSRHIGSKIPAKIFEPNKAKFYATDSGRVEPFRWNNAT